MMKSDNGQWTQQLTEFGKQNKAEAAGDAAW